MWQVKEMWDAWFAIGSFQTTCATNNREYAVAFAAFDLFLAHLVLAVHDSVKLQQLHLLDQGCSCAHEESVAPFVAGHQHPAVSDV
jgi:hypothetical protein